MNAELAVEIFKAVLDWTSALAWPILVLVLALLFRNQLRELLRHVGGIAERAGREPVEVAIGEKLRLIFREKIKAAEPRSIEEATEVAANLAQESLSMYELFRAVPLNKSQRQLLRKLVNPVGAAKAMTVEEARRLFAQSDIDYLLRRGLVVEAEQGLLKVAHDLVAAYVAAELEK